VTLFVTILAVAAFAVAVLALGLAITVAKQSGAVASTLQKHRLAHAQSDGAEDPGSWDGEERRRLNLGPPRHSGERRRELPPVPPGQLTVDEEATAEQETVSGPQTAQIRRQLPRPGQLGQRR
jgi:hypothetical protein